MTVASYAVAEHGIQVAHARHVRKRRPRLPRDRYIGPYRYSLTFCTSRRAAVFVDADTVDAVMRQILTTATDHRFEILAYCFMPDHLHLLVEGRDARADFTRFGKVAKQRTSYEYRRRSRRALWQPGWFDRQLQVSDDVGETVDYILMNPVRAGLSPSASEYPFSGIVIDRVRHDRHERSLTA